MLLHGCVIMRRFCTPKTPFYKQHLFVRCLTDSFTRNYLEFPSTPFDIFYQIEIFNITRCFEHVQCNLKPFGVTGGITLSRPSNHIQPFGNIPPEPAAFPERADIKIASSRKQAIFVQIIHEMFC